MALVILFDDEREFIPGFRDEALVVRDQAQAQALFESLRGETIHELWLDYVLWRGDTTEALFALEGVNVERIIFHSSSSSAFSLVQAYLGNAGITTLMERPQDYSVLVNPRAR